MKTPSMRILLALLALGAFALTGCSESDSLTGPVATESYAVQATTESDIVDTAIAAGAFETLVAAVQAAELEGALRGDGPLTVFAPTDDAFAKLPEGLVEKLLLPQNKAKLQELLLYHVVAGQIESDDLRWFQFEKTLQGQYLWIRKLWSGGVKVNDARIDTPDVMASNGVIHVIDTVLIPRGFELDLEEPQADIVDTAVGAGAFGTLVAAVQAAGLEDALRGEGPLTVFAPTDEAFSLLPEGLVAALLLPENKSKLQELLLYHVLAGEVRKADLKYYQRVPTLQGDDLRIIKWFGNVWVNRSRVVDADVLATNGVIHAINRVLIPEGFTLETEGAEFERDGVETFVETRYVDEAPPENFPLEYLGDGE